MEMFTPKSFDSDSADTPNNKQRFKEFLKIPVSSDIKHIYCYADEFGPDADYSFAFECSKETKEQILKVHQMVLDSNTTFPSTASLQHDFKWWNKAFIQTLDRHVFESSDQRFYKYFWYDKKLRKAYFFQFDL